MATAPCGPHDHDRAQALESHTFRKSGGYTTGVGLSVTIDTFDHVAAATHGFLIRFWLFKSFHYLHAIMDVENYPGQDGYRWLRGVAQL